MIPLAERVDRRRGGGDRPSTACPGYVQRSAAGPSTGSARRPATAARPRPPSTTSSTRYLHLYALNRGVLLTPFHNMALMSPATTAADVDRHTEVFADAVGELAATG